MGASVGYPLRGLAP